MDSKPNVFITFINSRYAAVRCNLYKCRYNIFKRNFDIFYMKLNFEINND